ncbi:hypothetical protein [Ghiorsea bivora]|uniref:hypothetical protein n=1 Tax=Ghiorsea bivora TaxID=1485545 RepID=UPI0018E06A04|nr:hypothetical protein [Ghiorsea bivora]
MPLPQGVPESISAFSPGTLQDKVVDPYLGIAKLRQQFEGKGRRLGGVSHSIAWVAVKR